MYKSAYAHEELLDVAGVIAHKHGIREGHDKDDAIQTIALAMLQAEEKAEPGRPVRTYQWTCGMGVAKNFLKVQDRTRTRERTILNSTVDQDGEAVDMVYTMAAPVHQDRDDCTRAIHGAIAALPEREGAIVRAHLLDGQTLTAIAQDQGFSVQYAHQILVRAKGKLAGALAEWQ